MEKKARKSQGRRERKEEKRAEVSHRRALEDRARELIRVLIFSPNGKRFEVRDVSLTSALLVEACGICMSIVSVVDRSLPKMGCKTCSAIYHSSCLLKVRQLVPSLVFSLTSFPRRFNTSHGSSCP